MGWVQGVFDCLGDAIFIHDASTGAILHANSRACELYGYSPGELCRCSVADISSNVSPYSQEDALRWMQRTFHDGMQLFEWQARARSGSLFWVEVHMSQAVLDGHVRLVVSVRDISRRKLAEHALRQSEERFRLLLGSSRDPVYCLNLQSLTYDYLSPAVEQMLGLSMNELMEGGLRLFVSRIHPDDMDAHCARLDRLVLEASDDRYKPVVEYRFLNRSMGFRWMSDSCSVVRDPSGRPTAIIGNIRDVTLRREHEEALQKAHAALLFHLESSSLALVETDANFRVKNWSPQAERIFGWRAEEVRGRLLAELDFIHPEDEALVASNIRRLQERSESRNSCVSRNLRKDGRVRICEWHNSAILDEKGELLSILSLATDITNERRIEDALRAMAQGVAGSSDEAFFQFLCLNLARILEMKFACVAMLVPERDRMARTLGFAGDGVILDNMTYSLVGTPCHKAFDGEVCYFSSGVQEQFPDDLYFKDQGVVSYIGVPLHSGDGRTIGILSAFSDRPMDQIEQFQTIFQIFAARAAAALERHLAESALRISEERYALAASASAAGVWDWDLVSGVVYYSPRFREMTGYSQDELPNTVYAWERRIHPDDLPIVRESMERHLHFKEPYRVDYRFLTKKDGYHWFSARGQAIWNADGDPCRMAGSHLDIHDLKMSEERVRRLNRLYAVASGINDVMVRVREPQRVFAATAQIAVDTGMLKMAWVALYDSASGRVAAIARSGQDQGFVKLVSEAPGLVEEGLGVCGQTLRTSQTSVYNDVEADESYVFREEAIKRGYRSCAAFPIKPAGKCVGCLVLYADEPHFFKHEELRVLNVLAENLSFAIESSEKEMARLRAVDALAENERMLSTLLSNLPGAAFRCRQDHARTLEFISEGCTELSGYEPADLIGNSKVSFARLMHPDDLPTVQGAIAEALAAGRTYEATYRIHAKDGKERWIWERGQGISSENGRVDFLEGFITDVTEKRQLESQFLRAQRMESIGTLAGGIAHDLNNILAPIMMALSILKMKLGAPRDKEMLKTLESNTNRGADMVQQILSFARGVEGKSIHLRPKNIVKEIERIVKETFPKNIEFKVAYADDLWELNGDPTQLHQMLLNLCVNARDAMPNGGMLSISLSNTVIDERYVRLHPEAKPGSCVVFAVKDTGMGIPLDIRDRIFEPFFTTKEFGKGTGLGLSTTIGIVKSHHGVIEVDSQPGQGTVFRILLPARPGGPETKEPEKQRGNRKGHGELVLVVDDEKPIRDTGSHILETFGYRVMTAANGAEAVEMFRNSKERPSIVFTDMMMPIMDGPAMIRELRSLDSSVRFVGASGLNNELAAEARSLGVRHFLHKPYTTEDLLMALADTIEGVSGPVVASVHH
ncbi:PAS domain-containing protein [Roseimicrobium sp. ORNL1]|uniref:PAS domain-containing protein n=1 Tax=Roseimicrobium sp. ORNL1 TaxID=2711231 RepID=UPI0013E1EB3B|nr:PAS domain-containing protein [Roseimicrobium sp. ORNL1]QIF01572.1 PAS domain-containing protein [Roseimicrobium sp. ORNL1]